MYHIKFIKSSSIFVGLDMIDNQFFNFLQLSFLHKNIYFNMQVVATNGYEKLFAQLVRLHCYESLISFNTQFLCDYSLKAMDTGK